ncbi:putative chaperonin: PROVISIONAL [Paratrimastix pyriformis]|uniref:Chaperonin: PROVISIONAL n=1 Tax=Paratrimastix pyriformis TaxID=342808 RepID=A0ABQ8UBZ3_9EUKA|nr:putative chaperonin: PROVISIONAL [Paratrimastix pyriformis]
MERVWMVSWGMHLRAVRTHQQPSRFLDYGNTGQLSDARRAVARAKCEAVLNYADAHVIPSGKDPDVHYYESLRSLHRDYQADHAPDLRVSWSFFRCTIRLARPKYRSRPSYTDVCARCVDLREQIGAAELKRNDPRLTEKEAVKVDAKLEELRKAQTEHHELARTLREEYKNRRETTDAQTIALDADFKMDLCMPRPPAVTQAFFFESKLMVYTFGIVRWVKESEAAPIKREPTFYLYPEHQAGHKGANHTLSLLDSYLEPFKNKGFAVDVQADNCTSQNKCNTIIWYWLYAMSLGWFTEVRLHYLLVGHTKFSCDSAFGGLSHLVRAHSTGAEGIITPNDIADLVNKKHEQEHAGARAVLPEAGVFKDWTRFLAGRYAKLCGISTFREVCFHADSTCVSCRTVAGLEVTRDLRPRKEKPCESGLAILSPLAFTPQKYKQLTEVVNMLPTEASKLRWMELIRKPFADATSEGRPSGAECANGLRDDACEGRSAGEGHHFVITVFTSTISQFTLSPSHSFIPPTRAQGPPTLVAHRPVLTAQETSPMYQVNRVWQTGQRTSARYANDLNSASSTLHNVQWQGRWSLGGCWKCSMSSSDSGSSR